MASGDPQETDPVTNLSEAEQAEPVTDDTVQASEAETLKGLLKQLNSIIEGTLTVAVEEQLRAAAEDPANGVFAVIEDLVVSGDYAPDVYRSSSLEQTVQIKSSEGVIAGMSGRIDTSASDDAYYLQVWDGGTSGDLIWSRKVDHISGSDTFFDLGWEEYPLNFPNSLDVAVSTTEDSYTAPGSGVARFRVQYK